MGELQLMEWILNFRTPILDLFFNTITWFGTESFIILSLPLLWHSCGKRFTFQVFAMTIFCFTLISLGKETVERLRPYHFIPELWVMDAPGYSMPSGHSLLSFTYWSMIMALVRERWMVILGSFMILSVGFSRIYFCVHYPTDVLVGWLLGALCLLLYLRKGHFVFQTISQISLYQLVVANIIITSIFFYIYPMKFFVISAGAWNGFTLGLYRYLQIEHLHDIYKTHRLQSLITMMTGTLVIGLTLYEPSLKQLLRNEFGHQITFIGYLLLTYWVSYGSHWVCKQWIKKPNTNSHF